MVRSLYTFSIEEAANVIKNGGIVAFPTETVYGLGADVFNEKAVERIFEAKERPVDNPFIVHIADRDQIPLVASHVSEAASKLIAAFFPGPLTIVLPKSANLPLAVTAGLQTVGVRMPAHDLSLRFLKECGTPVAAPSANLSGRPSPTTWKAVAEDLDGRIDCILKNGPTQYGLESTVVDCSSYVPVVLRTGAVTLEELREIVPEIAVHADESPDKAAKSPGLRHRHYSPKAKVRIVSSFDDLIEGEDTAFIGMEMPPTDHAFVKVCYYPDEYARSLFDFFRECDRRGISIIYCQAVVKDGIGAALMDRMTRAAE